MSALGLDDHNHSGGVRTYAPRHYRGEDDGATIRPVLERLSRGEGREPGPRLAGKAVAHDLPPVDIDAAARKSMPAVKRLAVVIGALAAMAVVGAAIFDFLPRAETQAAAPKVDPTALPKPVQTTIIRKTDEAAAGPVVAEDTQRAPQAAPANVGPISASAVAAMASADPLLPSEAAALPLQLWAMIPPDAPTGWPDTTQDTVDQLPASTRGVPVQSETSAPARHATVSHHARHVVSRQRSGQHQRRRSAPRAAAQADQATDSEQQATQPVKKLPLQAAIDRIFGNGATNGADANSVPAPQQ